MIRWLSLILLLFFWISLEAQQTYTISGYVKDAASVEDLLGVTVYDKNDLSNVTSTNSYGFYSLTLPAGNYTIVYQYIGFEIEEIDLQLDKNISKTINLSIKSQQVKEAVITAEREDQNIQSTEMGTNELTMEEVKEIPALFGEVDILKTLQLLPGVQSGGEGMAGFYVRGGGPDQNLILLDEATVYNAGHLFGFFSVFNADAIKNTTLIKGGMPANYGGRLSSVVDISMKNGNNKHFGGEGGVGLISSRLTLEGPIVKDKASFMVSGRRTYADVLIRPFLSDTSDLQGNSYYFYDLNAKVNFTLSGNDRLYASGYFGRDVFSFKSKSGDFKIDIPWGNSTFTTRWNHLFNDKVFMNVSAIYNDYQFETSGEQGNFIFTFGSGIQDVNIKADLDYWPAPQKKWKFGMDYTYHIFTPSTASLISTEDSTDFTTDNVTKKYAHEGALYALYETDISDRIRINAGIRYSIFQQVGPYVARDIDAQGKITDSTIYGPLAAVKTFHGPEPRFSVRYLLNEKSSIKGSVTYTNQYIHLVSNSNSTLPTDVWVPSSRLVAPQKAVQYAAGYFQNFSNNRFETSVELYYKNMRNQIEFEDGYIPAFDEELETRFVFGRGWSYGAEFFIKKAKGDLTGWIGYTLSFTERKFPDINNGVIFPAKYDRRHDISVVMSYDISNRVTLSGTFVYGTGPSTTIPQSWYVINGQLVTEYGPRNSFRLADYHRADLSVIWRNKPDAKFQHYWVFAAYNVYNRLNPFFIFFESSGNLQNQDFKLKAKQVSLFPIIPSISWNFKF